jgi:hypothetical protein
MVGREPPGMHELADSFAKIREAMDRYGDRYWSDVLRQHEVKAQGLDPKNREDWRQFLSSLRLLGGMGSLNDLVISKQNGHVVDDEAKANQELSSLVRNLASVLSHYRTRYGVK